MKIQNINKLILKFICGGIIKVPTKYIKCVDIEGDNNDENVSKSIELNDLKNFNISVVNDSYYFNCEVGQDIQINEIFNIVPFDVFKTLMSLELNYNIVFNITNSDTYGHSSHIVTLKPNGINHNIQIITQTIYNYPADYYGVIHSNNYYDIGFMFDGENLLQVIYKTDLYKV